MRTRSFLTLAAAASLFTPAVSAQLINQLPWDGQNGQLSQDFFPPGSGDPARAADDFRLPGSILSSFGVTRLRAVLMTDMTVVPGSAYFEIYADSGAGPANAPPLFTFPASSVIDHGPIVGPPGFREIEFIAGNGSDALFFQQGGVRRWISVVGTNPPFPATTAYFATFSDGQPIRGEQAFRRFGADPWEPLDVCCIGPTDLAFAIEAYPVDTLVLPLLLAGDLYGNFLISSTTSAVENLAVNNAGQWLIESDTDNPDTNADAILLSGQGFGNPFSTVFAEGQPIPDPAGAAISSFDAVRLNNHNNAAFNIFLDNLTTTTDSGVFFNTTLIIQESDLATAPGLSANTPYIGWFEVLINDENDVLMLASVDDPNIASTVDRAIVRIDEPLGAATQSLLLKEGDTVAPGRLLADVATGPHNIGFAAGSRTILIADMEGDTADDTAIYVFNSPSWTIAAREGGPSHIAGRTWGSLASAPVAINDSGRWAARATLNAPTADDSIIVRGGDGSTTIAREGSTAPAISPFLFTTFGTGAVAIDNAGRVFYYGAWNDPDTTRNKGLFRGDRLLVQTGITYFGDDILTDISAVQDNFAVSTSGNYLIFEGVITNPTTLVSRRGAFLIQIVEPGCPADFNNSGAVTSQDIFDFLAAFFTPGSLAADFNNSGAVTSQDIFDFLAAFFTPCP